MSEMNKEHSAVEVMENAVEAAAEAAQPAPETEAVGTDAQAEELAQLKKENADLREAAKLLSKTLENKTNDNAILFNRYFETLELNRDLSRRVLATLVK
ncbi:MAG: hypothetical protein IJ822_04385 [Pyramidobacter sp.]|nr:hypothetical protein [Pyramidobacter sp.]MBQ8129422.1 hypothetical protein [Clostridia bacterium]MBR1895998.1 hypothetical protein [Pyramidobacter sp.]